MGQPSGEQFVVLPDELLLLGCHHLHSRRVSRWMCYVGAFMWVSTYGLTSGIGGSFRVTLK